MYEMFYYTSTFIHQYYMSIIVHDVDHSLHFLLWSDLLQSMSRCHVSDIHHIRTMRTKASAKKRSKQIRDVLRETRSDKQFLSAWCIWADTRLKIYATFNAKRVPERLMPVTVPAEMMLFMGIIIF